MNAEDIFGLFLVIFICLVLPWLIPALFGQKSEEKEKDNDGSNSNEPKQGKPYQEIIDMYNPPVMDKEEADIENDQISRDYPTMYEKKQKELLKTGLITKAEYNERIKKSRR